MFLILFCWQHEQVISSDPLAEESTHPSWKLPTGSEKQSVCGFASSEESGSRAASEPLGCCRLIRNQVSLADLRKLREKTEALMPAQFWWHLLQMHSLPRTHAHEHVRAHAHPHATRNSITRQASKGKLLWQSPTLFKSVSCIFSISSRRKCRQLRSRQGDAGRQLRFLPSHSELHGT